MYCKGFADGLLYFDTQEWICQIMVGGCSPIWGAFLHSLLNSFTDSMCKLYLIDQMHEGGLGL
jgi:hypothetical protein